MGEPINMWQGTALSSLPVIWLGERVSCGLVCVIGHHLTVHTNLALVLSLLYGHPPIIHQL